MTNRPEFVNNDILSGLFGPYTGSSDTISNKIKFILIKKLFIKEHLWFIRVYKPYSMVQLMIHARGCFADVFVYKKEKTTSKCPHVYILNPRMTDLLF